MHTPELAPTPEEFAEWVHDALNRLYDLPYLQAHPLLGLLRDEAQSTVERVQGLRRLLLSAIRVLRPDAGAPADSPDWRGYRILELRYIEGIGPSEVMQELALGRSQFFREQKRILDALAASLWDLWQRAHAALRAPGSAASDSREELFSDAVEQLTSQATWDEINLAQLFAELQTMVEPLAKSQGAAVRITLSGEVDKLAADRVLLRQAILTLLTSALCSAPGSDITLSCFVEAGESGVCIASPPPTMGADQAAEGVAHQLAAAMGGSLRIARGATTGWLARMAWPTANPLLLVIDDHEGFVDLYRRFLAGRRWHVVGATSGHEALAMLERLRPTVIMLDVLMPSEDGWELLVTLKARDETRHIPVIVCSVLDQARLALALGAAGYLAKPVVQRELVRILDPWQAPIASPEIRH